MGYLRISSFLILINYIDGFNTNNVASFFHNPNFRCLLLFINGILLLHLLKLFVDSTQILTFPWNKSAYLRLLSLLFLQTYPHFS